MAANSTSRVNRAYTGITTFLRSEHCPDPDCLEAEIAVLGVPYDEGSPFQPGSRFAPRALREQSLRFGTGGIADPETGTQYLVRELSEGRIADMGDVDVLPSNPEGTMANATALVRQVLARGALPVVLGGDHAITYPIVRAYDRPIHVVQLDAHMDYAPVVRDMHWTNGQAFRLLHGLPTVESLTQIGIRSRRTQLSQLEAARAAGSRVIGMGAFRRLGPEGIAALLPEGAPCYVSIDVDALDISLVPGCVSGEPDGLSYPELADTLKALAERTEVIGFDFVEVNPMLDVATGATSYLGALTVVEFLGHICAQPRWRDRT